MNIIWYFDMNIIFLDINNIYSKIKRKKINWNKTNLEIKKNMYTYMIKRIESVIIIYIYRDYSDFIANKIKP